MSKKVPLFIDGEFIQSTSEQWIDVTNPATQEVIAQVPCATQAAMQRAVARAKEAFLTWKEVPVSERARVMMRYQALVKEHHDEISTTVASETVKTFDDAGGVVWRGIAVVRHAAHIPSLLMGETVEYAARGIDSYSYPQPLGVCAGIAPFNFPPMIPL